MPPLHKTYFLILILIIAVPLGAYLPRRVSVSGGIAYEKWADSGFPITWQLNSIKSSNVSGSRDLADVVRLGFQAWSSVPTARVSFQEGSTTPVTDAALDRVNLVSWVPSVPISDAVISMTVLYSSTQAGTDALGRRVEFPGQILEADILFNPKVSFSLDLSPPADRLDIQSRVTHEIGHLLGLDHSGLASAVMFPTLNPGAQHLRTLSTDDVIGISTLYPTASFSALRGGLRGSVRTTAGSPAYGAHVVVVDGSGRPVVSTVTEPDGAFEVQGLEPGNYSAFVEPLDGPMTASQAPSLATAFPNKTALEAFTTRFALPADAASIVSLQKTGGDNQNGNIGDALTSPIEVQLSGSGGAPLSGIAVSFAGVSGGGAVAPIRATTDAEGKARTTAYLGSGVTQAFTASAGASSVTFTASLRAPALASVTANSGLAGTSVTVTLAGTNFSRENTMVTASGGGITVGPVTVMSPSSLKTTFTIDANAAVGAREVRVATAAGISGPVTFTVSSGTLSSISVLDAASDAVVKELIVNQDNTIQARLRILDSGGNLREGVNVAYSSINPEVATVDAAGNIRGKKAGFSTLTVSAAGIVATATITVVQVSGGTSGAGTVGVARDLADRLYLASSQDHTIRLAQGIGQTPEVYAGIGQNAGFTDNPRLQALFRNPSFLAINQADGTLYVSDANNHAIRKITPGPAGRVETLAGNGTAGSADGSLAGARFNKPQGLALDNKGNLWVVDSGNHTVRRLDLLAGTAQTVAGLAGSPGQSDGAGAQAKFNAPSGIAIETETLAQELNRFRTGAAPGQAGVIVADTGNGLIRRVRANGQVETVASASSGAAVLELQDAGAFKSAQSFAISAAIESPVGVAVDVSGNIFVTQPSLGAVKVILSNGDVVSAAQSGTFKSPQGVVLTAGGRLLVTDGGGSAQEIRYGEPVITNAPARISSKGGERVTIEGSNFSPDTIVIVGGVLATSITVENTQRVSFTAPAAPSGLATLTVQHRGGIAQRSIGIDATPLSALPVGHITTVAGGRSFAGDGSAATAATLAFPSAVTVDSKGDIYFVDILNYRIRKITAATGVITTVAGNGQPGFSGDGGPATAASLSFPQDVAVDGGGNLYIADWRNHRVRKVNGKTGIISTVAGTGEPAFSGDGGAATSAKLNEPVAVAVEPSGDLYISDFSNRRVRKVSAASGIITTVAGNGQSGFSNDVGPATETRVFAVGLALDAARNLYIVGGSQVRKVTAATGIITTVAGPGNFSDLNDGGPATAASLGPRHVAFDAAGNFFITDERNQRIRRVDAATGIITTVAGNGQAGFSGDGAAATSASFHEPNGIAVDGAGNLIIGDFRNHRIRRVSAKTGTVATISGGGSSEIGDNGPATDASLLFPGGVDVDSSGNLFVADSLNYRVRKVLAGTGVITTVAGSGDSGLSGDNGQATSATFNVPFRVRLDSKGNLFIADSNLTFTKESNNRVRKVSNGVVTTVAGTGQTAFLRPLGDGGPATAAGLRHPGDLAVDSGGNLYIADTEDGRVRRVEAGTGIITTTMASLNQLNSVAVDAGGDVYVGELSRIRRISNGVISTVAGNGQFGFSGDGGPATNASIATADIAVDGAGNLYLADYDSNRIRKVSNGVITTIAGNGQEGFSGDGGPATSAALQLPMGVAVDQAGSVYIADFLNHRIRKVANGVITTIAGTGVEGFSGDNGPATSAMLSFPSDIVVAQSGDVYFAESNKRVRKVSAATGIITTVAGNGQAGFSGDGGPATAAAIDFPSGIALDGAGNLFVAVGNVDSVRKVVLATGIITTVAGNGLQSSGGIGDGELATTAILSVPLGVAIDSQGNIYIADTDHHRIRKVEAATGMISTVAGNGQAGFSGDGGPATSASINSPDDVTVDSAGNLYIADAANGRVRKVSGGIITTIAGNGQDGFSGDGGPALSAALDVNAIRIDSSGNIFIAGGGRVRRIVNGIITTVAGNGQSGFSGDNGPATSAALLPYAIALDSAGNLYIADFRNHRIRAIRGPIP